MTSSVVITEEVPDCINKAKTFIIPTDDIGPDIMTAIEDIDRGKPPTEAFFEWLLNDEIRNKYTLHTEQIVPTFKPTKIIRVIWDTDQ